MTIVLANGDSALNHKFLIEKEKDASATVRVDSGSAAIYEIINDTRSSTAVETVTPGDPATIIGGGWWDIVRTVTTNNVEVNRIIKG